VALSKQVTHNSQWSGFPHYNLTHRHFPPVVDQEAKDALQFDNPIYMCSRTVVDQRADLPYAKVETGNVRQFPGLKPTELLNVSLCVG
jgi:hypothetical protein